MGIDLFRQLFGKHNGASPTNMARLVYRQNIPVSREEMAKDIVKEYRSILFDLYGSATKVDRLLIFMDKNNNPIILQVPNINILNNFDGAVVRLNEKEGIKGISLCGKDKSDERLVTVYNSTMRELNNIRINIKNNFLNNETKKEINKRINNLEDVNEAILVEQMDEYYKEVKKLNEWHEKVELEENTELKKTIEIEMNKIIAKTNDIMFKLYARRQPAYKTNKQEVDEGIKSLILLKDGTIVLDLKDQGFEQGRALDVFKSGIKITRKAEESLSLDYGKELYQDNTLDRYGILRVQIMKESINRFNKYLQANPRIDKPIEIKGFKKNKHKFKR